MTRLTGSHPATGSGTREVVERDGGRFDMRYRMDEHPFLKLASEGKWMDVVHRILGQKPKLQWTGVVVAAANEDKKGTYQAWHADGEHLFTQVHCPPHCINVFVPLVDVNERNGATEFIPGSHKLDGQGHSGNEEFSIRLEARAGEAVIFDYRCQHRRGANNTENDRHVIYFTYSKEWWSDTRNHRSHKSLFDSQALDQIVNAGDEVEPDVEQSGLELQMNIGGSNITLRVGPEEEIQSVVRNFCSKHELEDFADCITQQVRSALGQVTEHGSADRERKRSADSAGLD
mmetsp:Transcript_38204/g.59633  ORF Transcript_38204/g.59633 Transcript_38204/m.59633 type:complete len:288 (-) Transcript_38204:129-992(-)